MTDIRMQISQLRAIAQDIGLSKSALAKRAGLAVNTLRNFWDDDWNPSLDTLCKLESALKNDGNVIEVANRSPHSGLKGKKILLIISGGIAAYKALDLIRRLQDEGATVTCTLTQGGAEFITPLSVSSLSGNQPLDGMCVSLCRSSQTA